MRRLALALLLAACGDREDPVSASISVRAEVVDAAEASVVVTEVKLLPCRGDVARLLERLSPISTAWAHTGHTEEEPAPLAFELSLISGEPQSLGVQPLAAGAYCELELGLSSLHVMSGDLHVRSQSAPVVRLPVSVTLDAEHRDAALALRVGSKTLLDDVDLATAGAGELLLGRLAQSWRVTP